MAVAITAASTRVAVNASSNVATYTNIAIGTAAIDRIVALCVATELASASANSATIDFGSGVKTMSAATGGVLGAQFTQIFYYPVQTGTTATITVTFGANPDSTQASVQTYRVVGAATVINASNAVNDTDADPITTGSVTVPANGSMLAVASFAADTTARTWTGLTEDTDVDAGAFRFTTGLINAGGAVTATVSGANNEDACLSWVTFAPLGSYVVPAIGTAAGTSTVSGVGSSQSIATGAGTAAGTSTVTGVSAASKTAVGSAAGASTVSGVGAATAEAAGSAAGTSTAIAEGAATTTADGTAAGTSTVTGVSAALKEAVGLAEGTSTAVAEGDSSAAETVEGAGLAEGTSTAVAVSAALKESAGSSEGTSTAIAVSEALKEAAGLAEGTSTAVAVGIDASAAPAEPTTFPGGSLGRVGFKVPTKKEFLELRAAWLEAQAKAKTLPAGKAKRALTKAVKVVAEVIEREPDYVPVDLTSLLEAAAGATLLSQIAIEAQQIEAAALALQEQLDEDDLLLLVA